MTVAAATPHLRAQVRAQAAAASLAGRPAFWLGLVLLIASVPIVRAIRAPRLDPLPVLATVPAFELTDSKGQRFGTDELRGKIWIANFIFTRCPTMCPEFTAKMARIQQRSRSLGDSLHLVSFTVDPEFDDPAVLEAYAHAHHANPIRWSFLTGPLEAVKKTVVEGLKVAMGREDPNPEAFTSIFHGSYFVLVDGAGRIRGYYDSNQADAIDHVLRDAGLVLNLGG